MNLVQVFAGKTGIALVSLALAAPLLGGCATQPSAPTIFGARIVPSGAASNGAAVQVAGENGSALTIFGVPVAPARHVSSATAVASMP